MVAAVVGVVLWSSGCTPKDDRVASGAKSEVDADGAGGKLRRLDAGQAGTPAKATAGHDTKPGPTPPEKPAATPGPERTVVLNGVGVPIWVGFSGDGKTLAAYYFEKTVMLWDVASGKNVRTLTIDPVFNLPSWLDGKHVAISPDGKTVAAGCQDKTIIKLWDVASGKNTATLEGHQDQVVVVAFSRDGKTLASGCADKDKTIKLWDVASGANTATLSGHAFGVWHLAFSPDGKRLASVDGGKEVRLWDVAGAMATVLGGHTERAFCAAFSGDGKTLASVATDPSVQLWDVATARPAHTFRVPPPPGTKAGVRPVFSVALSPDGRTAALADSDNTVLLWDVISGKNTASFKGHTKLVRAMAFSLDGKTLVSGGDDGTFRLWDVADHATPAR
jgi:WD40 repeat protein